MEKKSRLLRLIIEEREDVITWNEQIPTENVMECITYIKDLLRKKYSTDTFQYRDYENQHYDLEGILKFEVTPIFITIPHRTDVKTFTKVDPRTTKNLYAFKDAGTVKITKFENSKRIEESEMKVSAFKVLNQKHKDMEFEDPLLNETRAYNDTSDKLSNLQINNPVDNPNINNPMQFVQKKKEEAKDDSPDFKKSTQATSSTTTTKETPKENTKVEVKQDNKDVKVNSVNTSTTSNSSSTQVKTNTTNTSTNNTNQKSQSDFEKINSQNKNPMIKKVELQQYTLQEIAKHNTADDCWIVINGKVYDITKYIPYHPGGKKIMEGAGKDGTSLFSIIKEFC